MSQEDFSTTACDSLSYYSTSLVPVSTKPYTIVMPIVMTLTRRERKVDRDLVYSEWTEIDPDQMWYWTEQWQVQEREAEDDFRAGRYDEFATMDEFIGSLQDLMTTG
ncbi:MAG: hypothetical protein JXA14_12880 [Anaerolineae bacterium]|nr:hypothetical protein [Anaerolineae bacterium]